MRLTKAHNLLIYRNLLKYYQVIPLQFLGCIIYLRYKIIINKSEKQEKIALFCGYRIVSNKLARIFIRANLLF